MGLLAERRVAQGSVWRSIARPKQLPSEGDWTVWLIRTGRGWGKTRTGAEWVRYRVAFYASTPAYWPVLARHGLEDLGASLNRMTKGGQWDKIAAEVSDEVVNLFAAIGRHDEIAAAIAQRFGGASDAIFASVATAVPADLPPDLVQDIRRLPAVFTGFRR